MRTKPEAEALGIQSVQIGYSLVRALVEAGTPLSLGNLATRTGMSTSKARGYLLSYLQLGLVRQLAEGRLYDLGIEAMNLGLAAMSRVDAINLAREALPALHEALNETVCLSVWSEFGPVVFDKLDGPRQHAFALRIGTVARLLTTATGRVFLAHLPAEACATSLRRELDENLMGAVTRLDPAKIRADVLKHGCAWVKDLTLPGLASIAAPIFDVTNQLVVVVNVVGPSNLMDLSPSGRMATAITSFASDISSRAGSGQSRSSLRA